MSKLRQLLEIFMKLGNLETRLPTLDTFELEIPLGENDLITGFDPAKDIVELRSFDLFNSDPVQIDSNSDEVFQSELETDNFWELNNTDNRELIFESTQSSLPVNLALDSSFSDRFKPANQGSELFETIAFFNAPVSKWSQPGGKGNPVNITYSFGNLLNGGLNGISAADAKAAIEEAFDLWSSVAPLNFTEVKDSSRNSQIRIGYDYIDGRGSTLAYAYFPTNGDITFDSGDRWNRGLFLETAVHEIGHSLGLDHESGTGAIMNPTIKNRFNGLGNGFLLQDDINGIRSLYGSGRGSVNPLGSNKPTPNPEPTPTPTPSGPRRINGTMDDDVLIGNDRNNVIRGFAGNDKIEGGKGNDIIKGGKGADTFIFKSLDGSIDTIRDFSIAEGDRLEISRSGFGASSSNDFRYDSSSGGLFFKNEQFAVLLDSPSFSDVRSGFVLT